MTIEDRKENDKKACPALRNKSKCDFEKKF